MFPLHNRLKCLAILALIILSMVAMTPGESNAQVKATPWWKQQKIRFMWGQWNLNRVDAADDNGIRLSRQHFRNVAQAGGTVYVEFRGMYGESNARLAKEFGMKYFAYAEAAMIPGLTGGRRAIAANGEPTDPKHPTCPLDETIYHHWLIDPYADGIRNDLIDGIHVDWEPYSGQGEPDICYCDDCFSHFMAVQKAGQNLPDAPNRAKWLKQRNLEQAYETVFTNRRIEMFGGIRQELHALKPDLIFSSYGLNYGRAPDFARGVHTADVPFVYVSSEHYTDHDFKPWWITDAARWRKEGYLYISGSWTQSLFGAQASQVSAARWIYEAAVDQDGVWVWFERQLDDEILRAFASADRQIRTAEHAVGKYILQGERDPNYVTTVEWSGRPELEQEIKQTTYHLNDEHLAHLSNVHTEWPIRLRIRFPRIPTRKIWTVCDPLSGSFYTHDGHSISWTSEQLQKGVTIALEPRSDAYLLISPAGGNEQVDHSQLIFTREFDTMPTHEVAAAQADPITHGTSGKIDATNPDDLAKTAETLLTLPKGGWHFRMDTADVGVKNRWYSPTFDHKGWSSIGIETFWGQAGGVGAGWYHRELIIPELPKDRRYFLHFGGVDEQLMLWIDGQPAGEHNLDADGWDKPFVLDVTKILKPGRHSFTMRVYNSAMAGGVWKPVTLLAVPIHGESLPAGLLYTATEPMGYVGAEGPSTIGNAIRFIDPSGTTTRLRHLKGHLWSPVFSPDARRIAYVHDAGGRGQIYVMNADGTGVKNISNNTFCDRFPVWSPDGTRIAMMSDRDGDWDIWIMNADGGNALKVGGNLGLDRAPNWSPDGKQIVWESHVSGMPDLWIAPVEGGTSRRLISADHFKAYEIAAERTTKDLKLTFSDNTLYLTNPKWSPDGKHIAAVMMGGAIVVFDADGSNMLQLRWLPYAANLCWSPDSTQLAADWRDAPYCTDHSGIIVMNADGTGEGTIGPNGSFNLGRNLVDVTPQGPRLAQTTYAGPVHTWYSHGSAEPRRPLKVFSSLAWSPDGRTLAFSSDLSTNGTFYIYTIPTTGGDPTRLNSTLSAWPQKVAWSNPRH